MNRKINYAELSGPQFKQLLDLGQTTKQSPLGATILNLVNIRVSQINGCAFCVDMHSKEAKIKGERELRLYHLPIWRESPLFDTKERAALEWAEALTTLDPHGIPDALYERVRQNLSEKEISDLSFSVGVINLFNRLNIGFPNTPGSRDKMFGLDKAGLS
jgi:AhpD family alkylhydroperoxidase